MRPRLIALDIDGTLLPPDAGDGALPDAQITDLIARLSAAGVVVVLASGRRFPGTARSARHLGLVTPMICQAGACVRLLDGTLTHHFAIEPAIAHELVEFAREYGWPYSWFDTERYLASAPNPASEAYGRVSGITPEYHLEPHLVGIAPTGMEVISSTEHAPQIHRTLAARYGERVHLLDFPTVTVALAPEANKGNARAAASEMLAGEGVHGVATLLRHVLANAST